MHDQSLLYWLIISYIVWITSISYIVPVDDGWLYWWALICCDTSKISWNVDKTSPNPSMNINHLHQGCSTGGPGTEWGPSPNFIWPSKDFTSLEFFVRIFLPIKQLQTCNHINSYAIPQSEPRNSLFHASIYAFRSDFFR